MIDAWSMDEAPLRAGYVYKTHDYPPRLALPEHVRIIYTYADPVDIVASVLKMRTRHGADWFALHADHMKAGRANIDDIYDRDVLSLERHFDAWVSSDTLPVIAIRYDQIWTNRRLLSEFLKVPLHLKPFRPRETSLSSIPEACRANVLRTYARLQQKIADRPIFIAEHARQLLR